MLSTNTAVLNEDSLGNIDPPRPLLGYPITASPCLEVSWAAGVSTSPGTELSVKKSPPPENYPESDSFLCFLNAYCVPRTWEKVASRG